jgi:hypothetical protein
MPRRICVSRRVIVDVAVSVKVLRIPRRRHDGVGLDETPHVGVVKARVIVVQRYFTLDSLPRKLKVGGQPGARPSLLAEGVVQLPRERLSRRARRQ